MEKFRGVSFIIYPNQNWNFHFKLVGPKFKEVHFYILGPIWPESLIKAIAVTLSSPKWRLWQFMESLGLKMDQISTNHTFVFALRIHVNSNWFQSFIQPGDGSCLMTLIILVETVCSFCLILIRRISLIQFMKQKII